MSDRVDFELRVKVSDGYRETYKRKLPDAYGDGLARFVAVKAILAEGGAGELRDEALVHVLCRTAIMVRRVGGGSTDAWDFADQLEGLAAAIALSTALTSPRGRLGAAGQGGE